MVTIVILVSAVALAVLPGLQGNYQLTEGARLVQAAFAGARDASIRAGAPRGVRLVPDPSLSDVNVVGGRFVINRLIPIEPAPDLSEGQLTFVPEVLPPAGLPTAGSYMTWTWNSGYPPRYSTLKSPQPPPPAAPTSSGYSIHNLYALSNSYPYHTPQAIFASPLFLTKPVLSNQVKMVVESKFRDNFTGVAAVPNPPTNWFWNVRIGDKLRFNDSGQYYTVVGPMSVRNPELFVNIGNPGDAVANTDALQVQYTDVNSTTLTVYPEFLFLVNATDDDGNGFVDEGYNNVDENLDANPDDLGEWYGEGLPSPFHYGGEQEQWLGAQNAQSQVDNTSSLTWKNPLSLPYTIVRRPVPSPGSRDILLPSSVVIDNTTWNSTRERSRLPDPNNGVIDILLNPSGQVIPTTIYSTPAASHIADSFYHFWIADRSDVYFPSLSNPVGNYPYLPVPESIPGFPTASYTGPPGTFLKKDRHLVTLFTRSGQIVTNTINNFDLVTPDPNRPYFEAQQGIRETK